MTSSVIPMNNEILSVLYSLKEDVTYAWKQALEGQPVDLHKLGTVWKRLETAVIAEDSSDAYTRAYGGPQESHGG